MDYADECQNIWNDEQDRLEEIAMKEEEALEELLEDDQAIYELIADYDLFDVLGEVVRVTNKLGPTDNFSQIASSNFVMKILDSARHKVEQK